MFADLKLSLYVLILANLVAPFCYSGNYDTKSQYFLRINSSNLFGIIYVKSYIHTKQFILQSFMLGLVGIDYTLDLY